MKTDLEIAQSSEMLRIMELTQRLGIDEAYVAPFGRYKGKIDYSFLRDHALDPDGRLVLVTAINPTPAGEGKTTTTIGLGDALSRLGKKAAIALREPSLGPIFGIKGGACGGGYAQVVPMEEINLRFTGDIYGVETSNNLLAAMIDNHIHHGNALGIDPGQITWRRAVDMNDRQLRNIVDGLGGPTNGVAREDGFNITVASEVMAILCLANDLMDLKERLGRIVIGYSYEGRPVTAHDLQAEGAMTALLMEALKPNLVQTLEHTPAFVHGGPFANIAHGCNSVLATKTAQKIADYVVTEAGFGADLGAEKFIDIKCRMSGLRPSAAVLVASVRALKYNGGAARDALGRPDKAALKAGIPNLLRHIENIRDVFGINQVVAINRFPGDSEEELSLIKEECGAYGVRAIVSDVWERGGEGGIELAEEVIRLCDEPSHFSFAYGEDLSLEDKISAICRRVYRADDAVISPAAKKDIQRLRDNGLDMMPVCMAKNQYSFTDDASLLGAPTGFRIHVRNVRVSAGAGFIVALTGLIMTMPGLPAHPAAMDMDVDSEGRISGLF